MFAFVVAFRILLERHYLKPTEEPDETYGLVDFFHEFFMDPYAARLLTQAKYLFQHSELYELRAREWGSASALNSFHGGVAMYFLEKAKQEPIGIRLCLLRDAICNFEPRSYPHKEKK